MGNDNSTLACSSLGSILQNWVRFSYETMTKIIFCNTAGPQYSWDSGEKWPISGFINYNTILQSDFCKGKVNGMKYLTFSLLYLNKLAQKRCKILLQQHSDTKNLCCLILAGGKRMIHWLPNWTPKGLPEWLPLPSSPIPTTWATKGPKTVSPSHTQQGGLNLVRESLIPEEGSIY